VVCARLGQLRVGGSTFAATRWRQLRAQLRVWRKDAAITRCTIPNTGPMVSGLLANRKRNGTGKLSTHCRTGRGPNTSSTRPVLNPVEGCRTLSAMRRAPPLGQNPRLLSAHCGSAESSLRDWRSRLDRLRHYVLIATTKPTCWATGVQMSVATPGVSMETTSAYLAPLALRSRLGWSFHQPLTGYTAMTPRSAKSAALHESPGRPCRCAYSRIKLSGTFAPIGSKKAVSAGP